jgi:hypothetical protein
MNENAPEEDKPKGVTVRQKEMLFMVLKTGGIGPPAEGRRPEVTRESLVRRDLIQPEAAAPVGEEAPHKLTDAGVAHVIRIVANRVAAAEPDGPCERRRIRPQARVRFITDDPFLCGLEGCVKRRVDASNVIVCYSVGKRLVATPPCPCSLLQLIEQGDACDCEEREETE